MAITLLDVVDTTVKIGLGAIISALASYLVAKHNQDRELQKLAFTRRLDTLERVMEKVDIHVVAWEGFCSAIGGAFSGNDPPSPNFNEVQWDRVNERDNQLMASLEAFTHAKARLYLIGATEAADKLKQVSSKMGALRNSIILKQVTPEQDAFKATRKEVSQLVAAYYKEMSKAYAAMPGTKDSRLNA